MHDLLFSFPLSSFPSLHHQQPEQPVVREEDVTQLQEMFPSLDQEVVHSALAETSDGKVDSAITKLGGDSCR